MIYILPSEQIAITKTTGNGNAAALAVYLIDKFNLFSKYNKLSHGGFFHLTLKQVKEELGYGRDVFDKGIEVLIKLGIVQKEKFYVADAKSKLNHYKIIDCNYVSGFKAKSDNNTKKADAENPHHPLVEEKHCITKDYDDFGKSCNAEKQQLTITKENYNSSVIVNNINNNIRELISLSNNKLTEKNIKALLKECNNDYDVIREKLEVAISQYGSLDNIKNLTGWLRDAIRDNYVSDVEITTEVCDNDRKNISKIATTLGIRGRRVTETEINSIKSWLQIASVSQIIRAIHITMSHINKANHNYISRVLNSLTNGTYKSNAGKTISHYNQDELEQDNADLEAELIAQGRFA